MRARKASSILKCTKDKDGALHSYDGNPAVVFKSGSMVWCKHGKNHREDGPAFISNVRVRNSFWLNGVKYDFNEWLTMVDLPIEKKTELVLAYAK